MTYSRPRVQVCITVRTTGVESRDCASKKQLFDLLTSLCVHSSTGHERVVGALRQHKATYTSLLVTFARVFLSRL